MAKEDIKYKLGLDLGSTSLGWAVVELDENDKPKCLRDMGVRIFPDGRDPKSTDSLAQIRSEHRQMRVQYERKKMRKQELLTALQNAGLMPTDAEQLKNIFSNTVSAGDGLDRTYNPYILRARAVTERVEPYELGRIFWHLSKHRGFMEKRDQDIEESPDTTKKTKKETDADGTKKEEEAKSVKKGIRKLREEIKNAGCITLGQYLKLRIDNVQRPRFKTVGKDGKVENQTGHIDGVPTRKLYKEEFDTIWAKQREFYPEILTDEFKKQLGDNIIYYQRPLKKQPVGKCKFISDADRIAKYQPLFQEFRILQDVNDLTLDGQPLSDDQRMAVYHMLMDPRQVSDDLDDSGRLKFECIKRRLNVSGRFNMENSGRTGLLCNKTNLVMSGGSMYGPEWMELSQNQEKQSEILSEVRAYWKDKKDTMQALEQMGIASEAVRRRLLKNQSKLPGGYAELSKEAIEQVLPDMRNKGKKWHEIAIEKFGTHRAIRPYFTFGYNPPKQLPSYTKLFPESLTNGKIGNVTVHIGLNQLRAVVNSIIAKHGHPHSIVIEMARDIKMSEKALKDYRIRQNKNEKFNRYARIQIRKILNKSSDYEVSRDELERYKIWYNLHPTNEMKRYDYYCDTDTPTISPRDALSPEYEIEHIIPRSRGGTDGWANKILTTAKSNLDKGNKIPSEYLSPQQLARAQRWAKEADEAREAIKNKNKNKTTKPKFVFNSFAWRFEPDAMDHVNQDFRPRDLNDTRYLCRVARDYLSYICAGYTGSKKDDAKQRTPNVIASNGGMTDLFRSLWFINDDGTSDYLPRDYDKWEIQEWQNNLMRRKIIEELSAQNPEFGVYSKDKDASKEQKKHEEEQIKDILGKKTHEEKMALCANKKDRATHYHHALDALVLAFMTQGMVNDINDKEFVEEVAKKQKQWNSANPENQKTLSEIRYDLLKRGNKYAKPYAGFNDDAKRKLQQCFANLIISEKQLPDKLEQYLNSANKYQKGFTCLTEDTAYGFVGFDKINNGKIYIKLKVNENKSNVKKKKIYSKALDTLVPVFNRQHPNYKSLKKEFTDAVADWEYEPGSKEKLDKLLSTITRDKVFKWLTSAGNYAAEIHKNAHGKWATVEVMSNWWALQRRGRFWWRDLCPNDALVMKLRIGDIVRVKYDNATELLKNDHIGKWVAEQIENKRDLLFRVKKVSKSSVYLTPIHVANEDNDTKTWEASASSLQKAKAQKVRISILGDVLECN